MFTGLIEEVGTIARIERQGSGARLVVKCQLGKSEAFVMGESIAVDGACLTVVAFDSGSFAIDASAETLARTTLGRLAPESPVNLERATKLGARLGGHLVTGHVDDIGALATRTPDSGSVRMAFTLPARLAPLVAEKGSIAVNGVSLTVNAVAPDRFEVTVIPHTLEATTLGRLGIGDSVNLEVDLVARYVARLAGFSAHAASNADWLARLARAGYM